MNDQYAAAIKTLDDTYQAALTSPSLPPGTKARLSQERTGFTADTAQKCRDDAMQQAQGTATPEIALDCAIHATEAKTQALRALPGVGQ